MPTYEPLRRGEPVDLSNCESEPIHTPGSIQPHGVLLAVTEPELVVVQASVNTGALLGVEHEALLGLPLSALLESPDPRELGRSTEASSLYFLDAVPVAIRGRAFDGIVHRSGGLLILELEPTDAADDVGLRDLYAHVHRGMARLEQAPRLADLWPLLVAAVRDISGFDRVMVYRFDEHDGSGEVIAEQAAPGMESYLGLRYPASDVPQQARRLYLKSRLRLICSATYAPSPIVPADNPLTGEPLDLSGAVLRSVSPIHCKFISNMGTQASMSLSLVKGDRLWGLVACHHRSPRFVSYRTRLICGFLGDFASWSLCSRLEIEGADAHLRASAVRMHLVEQMSARPDLLEALVDGQPSALDLLDAGGFAAAHQGRVVTRGRAPSPAQLAELLTWLEHNMHGDLFVTNALSTLYPPAQAFTDVASGLLVTAVSNTHAAYFLWFRPEAVREVSWAGDPHKPFDVEAEQLTPRKSFALWKETVRERSIAWTAWDIRAATELRNATGKIILQKGAERLNVELRRAVHSRDDFLSMASHELRTPTTTLRLHLEVLRRMAGRGELQPEQLLGRIGQVERQVDRFELLIDHLLDVSRIASGCLELERAPCDLAELAREVIERFGEPGAVLHLDVEGDVRGRWDRFRLDQVLTNLLANAIKFGQGRPVDVTLRGDPERVRCAVRDRGIGISPDAQARIFDRFERAAPLAKFAGFGLGLWIVRQIIERHGGHITVDSQLGAGSTFAFELPRDAQKAEAA